MQVVTGLGVTDFSTTWQQRVWRWALRRQAGPARPKPGRNLAARWMVFALGASLFCPATPGAQAFDASLSTAGNDALKGTLSAASNVLRLDEEGVSDASEIIAAVQADYRALLGALYRAGYYGPEISIRVDGREGADLPLIALPSTVDKVEIRITPGPRFVFGQTQIAPRAKDTELPPEFAPGETARAPVVGAAKDEAIDAWRAQGHAKAALARQSITADHRARRLDVALTLDPGPAVTFGKLRFEGETAVRADRLWRIGNLPEGRSFDPAALDLVSRRLLATGSFRSVSLSEADVLNEDGSLDIIVSLADEKPRRFGFGAEISSLDGISLSAYWLHRNITGAADRLRIDGEIGGISGTSGEDYRLALAYRRPATVTRKTTLIFGAEIARLDEPDFFAETAEVTLGFEVEASARSDVTAAIGYRYSNVEDDLGPRRFRHIIFPITGTRDTRDDRLNPTVGSYLEGEIMPFIGTQGSASGTRLSFDGRGYLGIGEDDRLVIAARLQLGSIMGAGITEVPPDMLFYSGGGGTVRGQPYQSLGVDLGGIDTGGASFLGLSTELRGRITDKIQLVGFYDLGGISADEVPGQNAAWHAGAGLGLRYETGVGPIRFDIAAPVSGGTGDGVQIYLGIGQAF